MLLQWDNPQTASLLGHTSSQPSAPACMHLTQAVCQVPCMADPSPSACTSVGQALPCPVVIGGLSAPGWAPAGH